MPVGGECTTLCAYLLSYGTLIHTNNIIISFYFTSNYLHTLLCNFTRETKGREWVGTGSSKEEGKEMVWVVIGRGITRATHGI